MPKYFSFLLIFGYLLTTSVNALSAPADTPLSIYELAVKNDPVVRAALSTLKAQREKMDQSTGALLPEITITGEVASNREEVTGSGLGAGETSYSSNSLTLTLRQPIYRNKLFTDLDIAESDIAAAEATYKAAQQELVARVLRKFFEGLAARDKLILSKAERKTIKEQLNYTNKRYKVGKSTITDYLEAQAAFDLVDTQVLIAQDDLKAALDEIEEMTGIPPKRLAPLNQNFSPVKPNPANAEKWVIEAEVNNPILIAARYKVQSARYTVERFRSGHYPKLDVVAKVGTEKTGGRFGDSTIDDASVALQLEFPLYNGGQVSSKVREFINNLDKAKEDLMRRHREVTKEANKAYRNTMTALNRIKAFNVAVKSTQASVKAIKTGYKVGTRTNADILRVQKDLFKAKLDYEAAKYEYMANYFQLKNITGTLSKNDVDLIDIWFSDK